MVTTISQKVADSFNNKSGEAKQEMLQSEVIYEAKVQESINAFNIFKSLCSKLYYAEGANKTAIQKQVDMASTSVFMSESEMSSAAEHYRGDCKWFQIMDTYATQADSIVNRYT